MFNIEHFSKKKSLGQLFPLTSCWSIPGFKKKSLKKAQFYSLISPNTGIGLFFLKIGSRQILIFVELTLLRKQLVNLFKITNIVGRNADVSLHGYFQSSCYVRGTVLTTAVVEANITPSSTQLLICLRISVGQYSKHVNHHKIR